VTFEHHNVCKAFLLGCCPQEILTSTVTIQRFNEFYINVPLQRMDMGTCKKIHELAFKADYEAAVKTKDYFFDVDVSNTCPHSVTSGHI